MQLDTLPSNKTVLIVDDDTMLSEALAEFLNDEGMNVVTAANGLEALVFLKTHPLPGLIFTDMTMPEMTGAELVTHLKQNARTEFVPIILSSAVEEVESIAGNVGAQGYLKKPFRMAAMSDMIRQHMLA